MQRSTEELLQRLGLEPANETVQAPRLEDPATKGFVAEAVALFLQATTVRESQLDKLGPHTVEVGQTGSLDVTTYPSQPGLVRVGRPGSATPPAVFFGTSNSEHRTWPIDDRPGELLVDLGGAPAVFLAGGQSIVVEPEDDTLSIREVVESTAAKIVAPQAIVDEARAAGDAWLAAAIPPVLDRGEGWGAAVATGMFGRLMEETPARRAELLARIRAGTPEDRDRILTHWAGGLSKRAVQRLEDLAVAQCSMIRDELESLGEDDTFGSDDWRAGLQALCVARDELESAYLVLEAAGAGKRAWPLIETLDEIGTAVRRSLPRELEPTPTEQLSRARATAPSGWWTTRSPRG